MPGTSRVAERDTAQRPSRRDALANQERVLEAAVTAVLREGRHVPMATIAADAGVGVATLYRSYPNRDALMDALTHRSFALLVTVARAAEVRDEPAIAALGWWWDRVIDDRDQLVLPLGGGPPVMGDATLAVRSQLHRSLGRILRRGHREGSIRDDVTLRDVIIFGAMLVAPLPGADDWSGTARRQKAIYLDGLRVVHRTTPG